MGPGYGTCRFADIQYIQARHICAVYKQWQCKKIITMMMGKRMQRLENEHGSTKPVSQTAGNVSTKVDS